jgi:hypothetical protein
MFDDTWTGVIRFMMDTEEGGSFFAGEIVECLASLRRDNAFGAARILRRMSELMTHSNRVPDLKHKTIHGLLVEAWPPKSVQEAIGWRHLPFEAFEDLLRYSNVVRLEPAERRCVAALICVHPDPRIRQNVNTGYVNDTSPEVALMLNWTRCVKLQGHSGIWEAVTSQIERGERVDIACDDVRDLIAGWQKVRFFPSNRFNGIRILVPEGIKNIENLRQVKCVSEIIVECDDPNFAVRLERILLMHGPVRITRVARGALVNNIEWLDFI